jgi:hypothetical protein
VALVGKSLYTLTRHARLQTDGYIPMFDDYAPATFRPATEVLNDNRATLHDELRMNLCALYCPARDFSGDFCLVK